jgi:hypothetical protein
MELNEMRKMLSKKSVLTGGTAEIGQKGKPMRQIMKRLSVCLGGFFAATLAFSTPSQALEADFNLVFPNLGSGIVCGLSCGNVHVTDDGTNKLVYNVTLTSGIVFHDGNAGGTDAEAFYYSLSGFTGSLTVSSVSANWTPQSGPVQAFTGNGGGVVDGMGGFTNSFDLTLANPFFDGSVFAFTVTSTGTLTLANVVQGTAGDAGNGSPFYFVAEIATGCSTTNGTTSCTGPTGLVGANTYSVPGPIVGAGLPGLVMACGGLVALARRRRKLVV